MNNDHLDYFLAVCEEGTIARAAEHLFISPQGLGKALRLLEQSLGVVLFVGEGDDRRLTEYGEALRLFAIRMTNEREALERRFAEITGAERETVVVAFSYGVLESLGVFIVADFAETDNKISVDYVEVPDFTCEEMLLERRADIGFTVAPFHCELDTVELRRERSCLWVGPGNPLYNKEQADIPDLRDQRIAMIGHGMKMRDTLPALCRANGFSLDVAYSSPEMGTVKHLAGKNGIASLTVEHENISRPTEIHSVHLVGVDWTYGVSTVRGRTLSPAQQRFVTFVTKRAKSR